MRKLTLPYIPQDVSENFQSLDIDGGVAFKPTVIDATESYRNLWDDDFETPTAMSWARSAVATRTMGVTMFLQTMAPGFGMKIAVTGATALILAACKSNEPANTPQPNTAEPIYYMNQTDLGNLAEMMDFVNNKSRYIIASFAPGTHISVGAGDFDKLNQFLGLLNLGSDKVKFDMNGAVLVPAEKINLTDAQCDTLVSLWNKGLQFTAGAGAFWITSAQASKFTADMLRNLMFSDARPINIAREEDLGPQCSAALQSAKNGERVLLTVGPFTMNADSLMLLRNMWDDNGIHPNINAVFAKGTKAEVKRHPTEPDVLNSLLGMKGEPIDLVIYDNPKAPGKLNATCVNDTTSALLETKTTKALGGKNPGTFIARTVNQKGELVNPIVTTYYSYTGYDPTGNNLSVDGVKMVPFNISKACAGIYGGEDGSYYILAASYLEVLNGENPLEGDKILFTWNANEAVKLSVSKDQKYAGSASYDGKSVTGARIAYRDFYQIYGDVLGRLFLRPPPYSIDDQIKIQMEPGNYILLANDKPIETGWSEWSQIASLMVTQDDVIANAKKRMGEELSVDGCTFCPQTYTGTIPASMSYVDMSPSVIPLNDGTMARSAGNGNTAANVATQSHRTNMRATVGNHRVSQQR